MVLLHCFVLSLRALRPPYTALVDVRRQKWRTNYAKRAEKKLGKEGTRPDGLKEEVTFLTDVYKKEERMSQIWDLVGSLVPFMGFWLVGAGM